MLKHILDSAPLFALAPDWILLRLELLHANVMQELLATM
jgi:hypothetical protein